MISIYHQYKKKEEREKEKEFRKWQILRERCKVLQILREEIINPKSWKKTCSICLNKISKEEMKKNPRSYRVVFLLEDKDILSNSYELICWPCWHEASYIKQRNDPGYLEYIRQSIERQKKLNLEGG